MEKDEGEEKQKGRFEAVTPCAEQHLHCSCQVLSQHNQALGFLLARMLIVMVDESAFELNKDYCSFNREIPIPETEAETCEIV